MHSTYNHLNDVGVRICCCEQHSMLLHYYKELKTVPVPDRHWAGEQGVPRYLHTEPSSTSHISPQKLHYPSDSRRGHWPRMKQVQALRCAHSLFYPANRQLQTPDNQRRRSILCTCLNDCSISMMDGAWYALAHRFKQQSAHAPAGRDHGWQWVLRVSEANSIMHII